MVRPKFPRARRTRRKSLFKSDMESLIVGDALAISRIVRGPRTEPKFESMRETENGQLR